MTENRLEQIIFFADVVGSTKLYESLGDVVGQTCISEGLNYVSQQIKSFDGEVIEIIGDEVMASFTDVTQASLCACSIQKYFSENTTSTDHKIYFRIGFCKGLVSLKEDGHPFGETVNVASRLATISQAGQSITTATSIEDIPVNDSFVCRPFGRTKVKGIEEELDTVIIDWDMAKRTIQMMRLSPPIPKRFTSSLQLSYGSKDLRIEEKDTPFTIGRGQECSFVVSAETVSRIHLLITTRSGNWFLTDRSTNGTFVDAIKDVSGEQFSEHVHHEEWLMGARGLLGLGKQPVKGAPNSLEFVCLTHARDSVG